MFFFLLLVFLIVAASLWFHGLWGAGLSLINILIAGMIATIVMGGFAGYYVVAQLR